MVETMFETHGFEGLSLSSKALMTLYAQGLCTAVRQDEKKHVARSFEWLFPAAAPGAFHMLLLILLHVALPAPTCRVSLLVSSVFCSPMFVFIFNLLRRWSSISAMAREA
jgi:hypothetical protein